MPYKVIKSKFGKKVVLVDDPPQNDVVMKCGCGKTFLFTYKDLKDKSHLGELMEHMSECGQEVKRISRELKH